jgi:hypothetical protein
MKRILSVFLMLATIGSVMAQLPIGSFRDHLSYNQCFSVAVSDDYIYAAGENGIMYISKDDVNAGVRVGQTWSKSTGLSDVEVSKIAYDKKTSTLAVAYNNGNLDFIREDKLTNVPDVKNKQLNGSKSVRQIFFSGNNCYLVYQFGVVVLDMNTYLVLDTWYTSTQTEMEANNMVMSEDRIYLSTNKGVYSVDKQNPAIADFGEWQVESELGYVEYDLLQFFKGKIYVNRRSQLINDSWQLIQTDSVYVLDDGHWRYEPKLVTEDTRDLLVSDDELFLVNWQYVVVFDGENASLRYIFENGRQPSLRYAAADKEKFWVADDQNGLWLWNREYGVIDLLTANGPYSDKCFSLSLEADVLASVAGGYAMWAPAYFSPICNIFKDEKWSYILDEFRNYGSVHDLVNVAVNPQNTSERYVASWGNGLFKCVDGKVVAHYDETNSTLKKTTDADAILVSGLCFDDYGNLWLTNTNSPTIINVLKTDGSWVAMTRLSSMMGGVAQHIYVDSRGYKWITFPRSTTMSLYVYDDNKTIDNQSDDRMRLIDMNAAAEVESSVVKCITEDKNGKMWIGTNKGVKVIQDPINVFKGTALPRNIIMEQGGYTSVLLEFEEVSCIAVDGANRKWIGTSKAGVFLMSDNGTEEIMHLTVENSVLLSNVIYDIAINGITGEVFFATDKGLCSYRGTATEGSEYYEEVRVFPNPVHSGYTGVISVSGLMENSFCKIVDAAGNLIWQGYANGGELVWNGKDFKGRRPATGVYFVFSSSKSGKEKNVAKLLFVN